jgi:homoserine dehydrogenase
MRVALLGCGSVGSEVARLIVEHADDLAARSGARLQLAGIAVRTIERDAIPGVDPALFTTDAESLVTSPDVDIVIEVIGGIEPARSLILTAMQHGKSIVTANKALLAEDGPALHDAADKHGVDLYYETAVAGAIPLLRPLRESLAGDRITRVMGIVNGTTNFILDRMDTEGSDFDDCLQQAQELGYAETDPTADVEGDDAAAKAAILAGIAFHSPVTTKDVYREGITGVTAKDVACAKDMGMVVKLLAICDVSAEVEGKGRVGARVYPAMLPRTHPLASVRGPFNAVFVEAEAAGQLMFYGPGAGGTASASAVLGDLVTVARNRLADTVGPGGSWYADRAIRPIGDTTTRYHIRLDVDDRAGVLASVAAIFADHSVSIEAVRQHIEPDETAELLIVTHKARNEALDATVKHLAQLGTVRSVLSVMRVEGE